MNNPANALEWSERPKVKRSDVRVLPADDLRRLTHGATGTTRTMIQVAALSGLRPSELLALRCSDMDFAHGLLRVRYQLSRGTASNSSRLVSLKTCTPQVLSRSVGDPRGGA